MQWVSANDVPVDDGAAEHAPRDQPNGPMQRALVSTRYLVVVGAATSLLLAAASYVWSIVKAVAFVDTLLAGTSKEDEALVKLFATVDVVLIGTVMLIIGLGLWELFVAHLSLPPALTTSTFDDLKAKIATTLVLVLVVQFLEEAVQSPEAEGLLQRGIAVTLVGGLLVVFANWHPDRKE